MDNPLHNDKQKVASDWLVEDSAMDIIPETPPEETDILYCQCKKPSSVYPETNEFGHWLKCSDCHRIIEGSFESNKPYDD